MSLGTPEGLQPQDLVITLLGTYVRPFGGGPVWSGGLVSLLEEFGFSHGAARVALTRLVRRGLLERVRSGRLVHYRVTPRCDRLLAEGDGRIFSLGSARATGDWWTVVWHQIPEDRRLERTRLARRLRFLGFGSVQDSVWVSPHDHAAEVETLVVDLDVASVTAVFLASVGSMHGLPALVARGWDLTGLVDRYEAFVAEFGPFAGGGARAAVEDDGEAFLVRTRLVHTFRGFPFLDPELPEELAPVSGPREAAVVVFHSVFERLADASQRHFDAVTTATAAGAPARAPAATAADESQFTAGGRR
jgi:phenylacetic acid degradation operon negative regulatory protein